MRILVKSDDVNPRVMEGLHNAAFDCGFTSLIWNERAKASFDIVHEFNPDLVICYGSSAGSAIESACNNYSVDIVNVLSDEQALTSKEESLKAICYKPSADLLKCDQDRTKEHDIITLSEMQNRQILKLSKLGLKCFSYNNRISLPCYLGTVTSEESHQLLCSSKMFLLLSEDEELMCNCIASDCIPMFLNNNFLTDDILEGYRTQESFELGIQKVISDDEYRAGIVDKSRQFLFSNHTYHHRLSEVMKAIKKDEEATSILKRLEDYK